MDNDNCRHGYNIICNKDIIEYINFEKNNDNNIYITDIMNSLIDDLIKYFNNTNVSRLINKYKYTKYRLQLSKDIKDIKDMRVIFYDSVTTLGNIIEKDEIKSLIEQSSHIVGINSNGGVPHFKEMKGISICVKLNNQDNSVRNFLVDILFDIFVYYFVLDILGTEFTQQYIQDTMSNRKKFSAEKYKYICTIINEKNNFYQFDLNCFKNKEVQYFPLASLYRKNDIEYENIDYFFEYLHLFTLIYKLPKQDNNNIITRVLCNFKETEGKNLHLFKPIYPNFANTIEAKNYIIKLHKTKELKRWKYYGLLPDKMIIKIANLEKGEYIIYKTKRIRMNHFKKTEICSVLNIETFESNKFGIINTKDNEKVNILTKYPEHFNIALFKID